MEVIRAIIGAGVKVNAKQEYGFTAFILAVYNPNISMEVFDELKANGANINAQSVHGWSALMESIQLQMPEVTNHLI